MKKIVLTLLALFITFNCANAMQFKLFGKKETKEPTQIEEIESFFLQYIDASNEKNIEALKNFYDKNYISSDGFTYDDLFEIIQKTWSKFPEIKYDTIIKDIETDKNKASVELKDISIASLNSRDEIENPPVDMVGIEGSLFSTSHYIVNLEKKNNCWKIVSEKIIDEETSLRYGDARFVDIHLDAPKIMRAGEEYTASLSVDLPEETFVMGSITNEDVVYPPLKTKEVFRKLPEDGILERVLKANKDNVNEYVMASVGMTKAKLEGSAIKFVVSGAAFVVKKVDIVPQADIKRERTEQIVKGNKK